MDIPVGGAKQRIRLRRSTTSEQTIKQNIENLKMRSRKKLVAQLRYYGSGGQSPLVREVSVDDLNKAPVHQRLGMKRQNRVPILGTNTASIGPKRRDFRKILTNRTFAQIGGPKNYRNQKVTKMFSAQSRLQRIRNGFVQLNKLNNNLPQHAQRIRLRRATSVPKNYTVRVQNTMSEFNLFKHSIKRELNPRYQSEIHLIQQQHGCGEPLDFSDPILITATAKTTHQRFSELP